MKATAQISLSKSKVFFYSFLVFILAIAIASFLPLWLIENKLTWLSLTMFFLFTSFTLSSSRRRRSRKYYYFKIASIFLFVLFLSFCRYSLSIPNVNSNNIQFYNGEKHIFIASILSDIEQRFKSQKFIVEVEGVVAGKVLVTTEKFPKYSYGDRLQIECKLEVPEKIEEFSYDRYLAKSGIYSLCYLPKIELVESRTRSEFFEFIFKIKNNVKNIISSGLAGKDAGLTKAIILGEKFNITESQRDIFSRAGISHIVAISGMHIGIILVIISLILYEIGLWRSQIFYVGLTVLGLYVLMIGAPASAVRAFVMIFFLLLAQVVGRLNSLDKSVYYAAGFLLLINPKLLRDDIGFQLSFLAILAIIYLVPQVNNLLEKYKIYKFKWIINVLITTTVIQFLTAPILVYNFGQISIIAPIVNLLILWILPFLLFFILLAILLSSVLPSLAYIFFLPVHFMMTYIVLVAEFFSSLPFAYLEVENVLLFGVVYIVISFILLFFIFRAKRKY